MARTYPELALDFREGAKGIFHTLPAWIQFLLRKSRWLLKQFATILQPSKQLRTLAYHGFLYKIGKVEFRGLHLGCGEQKIPGFLNIDANPLVHCDVVARLTKLKLATASVQTIYASHVFEHFPREQARSILAEWFRVLKPSGKLFLCVPDLESLAKIYLQHLPEYGNTTARETADLACNVIYGGQSNRFDYHYYGYSYPSLGALLLASGFNQIDRFDRTTLDFATFSDGGTAMINDRCLSLNVVAVK